MRKSLTILAVLSLASLSLVGTASATIPQNGIPFVSDYSLYGLVGNTLFGYDEVMYYTNPVACSDFFTAFFTGTTSADYNQLADIGYDSATATLTVTTTGLLLGFDEACPPVDVTMAGCTESAGAAGGTIVECGNPLVRDDPYVFGEYASLALTPAGDEGFLYFQQNVPDPLGYEIRRITGDIDPSSGGGIL